jgi:predicted amidohydrolase YtcJ
MWSLVALWVAGDTLFLADRAWQVEAKGRVGIVVREGKIVFVGAAADAPKTADVQDFGAATILPGLHDAHVHLAGLGRQARLIDLRGCKSADEAAARVAAYLRAHPAAKVLEGRGWDQNGWPKAEMPSGAPLDRVSKTIPIVLHRVDGHAIWFNSAASAPGGVLVDNAAARVQLPAPSQREVEEDLREGERRVLAAGLTAVDDMGVDAVTLAAYRNVVLRVRVYGAPMKPEPGTGMRAQKIYADGALGSRGARLLAPYSDGGGRGEFVTADVRAAVLGAAALGLQPCVHAIGDEAVRVTLDAFSALTPEQRKTLRPRMEHAQVISPADLERFAPLNVIASMQPVHYTSDAPWAVLRLGAERMKGAYAWKALADRGVLLAFGSDAPVEDPNPFFALQAATQRGLTLVQAMDAFTKNAAFASFAEQEIGSLAPGKRADFTVIDGTLEQAILAPAAVHVRTVIGGR